MQKPYTYRIVNLLPKRHTGGYNFGIELDIDFANRAKALILPERSVSALEEYARQSAEASDFDLSSIKEVKIELDGGLLTHINLPGNACGLDIKDRYSHDDPEKPAFYWSHNVDDCHQAFCLIAIFANWEDFIRSVIACQEKERNDSS